MATILENESAWSTTAASNANVDTGVNWAENQDPASVNNSGRGMMAARRKAALDQGGERVATGTADALVLVTNQVLSASHLVAGLRFSVRAIANNATTTPTLAVDGLSAYPIKRADGSALPIGSIKSGMMLDLVYNAGSSEWRAVNIAPAMSVLLQIFPASGPYTPSAGMIYAIIECVGGGGGGGGCANSPAGGKNAAGGGGGGAYSKVIVTAAQVGASKTVTVGLGGGGAAAGQNLGSTGGFTSVGVLCLARGGAGGGGAASGGQGNGGSGGSAATGTGTFRLSGGDGTPGMLSNSTSVAYPSSGGGHSHLGFGAPDFTYGTTTGAAATNYGGGGAGGGSSGAAGNSGGGDGAAGVVVITEYC